MSPEALDALVRAGATAEMIVEAVKAEALADESARAKRREQARERQRRKRERDASEALSRSVTLVTRDTPSAPLVPPASPKPPTPPLYPPANPVLSAGPTDDVRAALEAWNAMAALHDLPKAKTLDKARTAGIRKRLANGGLARWSEALEAVTRSRHCRGENDRGWKADLDFLLQDKSWRRLLEGTYGTDAKPRRELAATGPPDPMVQARRVRHWRDTGEWKPEWGETPTLEAA